MEEALAHATIDEAVIVAHDPAFKAVCAEAAHTVILLEPLPHWAMRRARLNTRTILHGLSLHKVRGLQIDSLFVQLFEQLVSQRLLLRRHEAVGVLIRSSLAAHAWELNFILLVAAELAGCSCDHCARVLLISNALESGLGAPSTCLLVLNIGVGVSVPAELLGCEGPECVR